jgi:branched-chain amino acid transport system permease protein
VSVIAWALSGGLAALAAVLLAPLTVLSLGFGFSVMLGAFAAAVIGGFGSVQGVCAGALLIGFLEQFVGGYVFKDYASTLPFIAMLVILAVRPAGLFSTATERL